MCVKNPINPNNLPDLPSTGITPKADTVVVADKATGDAPETKAETAETSEVQQPPPDSSTGNALFPAAKNLNDHLTTLHAALPPRTALLLFSGHSDPRSMSTLATRRAEYQAIRQGKQSGSSAAEQLEHGGRSGARGGGREGARMGLLFVGVKA